MTTADHYDDDRGEREFADPDAFRGQRLRRVRGLLADVLREEGFEVEVHHEYVRTTDGREFGLQSLLGRCAQSAPVTWRQIVTDQVRSLLTARPDLLESLDLPGAEKGVFLRLLDRRIVPPELAPLHTYARPVVGDLVEMLVLEAGLSVLWLRDSERERLGAEKLREIARRNLGAVRDQQLRRVALPHGAFVWVLEGGGHTASQVLLLPEVLRRVLGTDDFPGGVLVAIPTKYELWLHPIVDHRAYAAYPGLFDVAVQGYDDGPGALSPYVYWWRRGELVQIMTERDGLPHVDDDFIRSTARIAEADDPAAACALLAELGEDARRRR